MAPVANRRVDAVRARMRAESRMQLALRVAKLAHVAHHQPALAAGSAASTSMPARMELGLAL